MTAVLPEEQQKALTAQIPLGKLGEPSDIAHAVAFLASQRGWLCYGAGIARQWRHVHVIAISA